MTRKERKKRKLKIISYWLLVIGLLFAAGCGFRVFGEFGGFGGSVWEGKGRVNWLMVNDGVWLVSLEPGNKNLVSLEVPNNVEIETTRGFGKYRIGAVYELGKLERVGGELIRESVQESFGIPVDGWIKLGSGKWEVGSGKSWIVTIFRNLILTRLLQTNFTRWDVFRLWWETRKILPNQIRFVQLEEIGALKGKVLVDGSRVWEIDQEKLDIWLQDNFYERQIREENLTMNIINLTDHDGLAARVARIVSNMGGRVIAAQSSRLKAQGSKCEMRSEKEKEKSFTVRRLLKTLGCQFVEEQESDGRAEVTVLVGEEYWRILNTR